MRPYRIDSSAVYGILPYKEITYDQAMKIALGQKAAENDLAQLNGFKQSEQVTQRSWEAQTTKTSFKEFWKGTNYDW